MVLTAPPTVVEVTRSVEERQDDGDDASARLAGEFLPRGDGNPAQLAVRRRRVFCEGCEVARRADDVTSDDGECSYLSYILTYCSSRSVQRGHSMCLTQSLDRCLRPTTDG